MFPPESPVPPVEKDNQTPVIAPAGSSAPVPDAVPVTAADLSRGGMRFWEPYVVFLVTLALLVLFTNRVVEYLTPATGDEPFYLMTAISILKDGDLNECNNYRQLDEALIYPSFYSFDGVHAYADFPKDWKGLKGAPYPLPPHPGHIVPASRQCASVYTTYPVDYDNPNGELYSKHGLGLSVLVLPAFAIGNRLAVVLFLNILGALLAANIYLLAREGTGKVLPAVLTWVAFAFTVPLMPYSYLIFPELPAALLTIYAFRRIRLMANNPAQMALIGLCVAALPWFHYRLAPISVGLVIYYFFRDRRLREKSRRLNWALLMTPAVVSAAALMLFFYQRYRLPFPNPADHAGISDVAGTLRGAVGLFLDQQWGLFVAAPIFILAIVGIVLMWQDRSRRSELGWVGVICVPYFLVIANYAQWWGEWCPPARYLTTLLPLLALPFAISLSKIKGVAYRGIYGVFLFLSLVTMGAYIYQPQWMYNQPTGRALIFTSGLSGLLNSLNIRFFSSADVVSAFPSFVQPYFAYLRSKQLGDAAVNAAWLDSIWLFALIALIVIVSLLLANRSAPHSDLSAGAASGQSGSVSEMPLPG